MIGLPDFDPEQVIRLLGGHRVRYVLIGGMAGIIHGAPFVTEDVDICHAKDPANLEALAAALRAVHAELRGAEPGLPFRLDATTLGRGDAFTFVSDIGAIDIMAMPQGTSGFEDLVRTAEVFRLFDHDVAVAAIDDLVRMKRAAGRPKDLLAMEELGALRDELDRRDQPRVGPD